MSVTGTWDVVSSPDFDDNYLHMEVSPYVELCQKGDRVYGQYHLGSQTGDLFGWLKGDDYAVFCFDGMDKMTPVDGDGEAILEDGQLIFRLMYYSGDEFTFVCERRR